jgi:predicted acylesterase/phospholipase RssA
MSDGRSTAASAPAQPGPTPLKETDVEYLALEGGGGKGFAYLGAIDMLEREGVMPRIKGFAGASAGAITALLLSVGYDYAALQKFLSTTDFDSFYDPPVPRTRPAVAVYGGLEVTDTSPAEDAFMRGDITQWVADLISGDAPTFLRSAAAQAVSGSALAGIVQAIATAGARDLIDAVLAMDPPPVARALLGDGRLMRYLAFLPRDMGLFSGAAARILFENILRQAAVKRRGGLPSQYANMGFQTHYDIFGKELLVTGTNLRSGKTQIFSRTETPYFPIADAVRISMGLPWVFKPYVITRQNDSKDPPCGVYVDGGVWNNLPFREFDSAPPEKAKTGSAAGSGQRASAKGPRTLGLRLEIVPLAAVDSVWALSGQMLSHGVLGSGESQVLDKYTAQCVLLDTRGLDLLSFSPPKDTATRERIANRSRRAICRYFGWPIEMVVPSITDDADDLATERARSAAETC